MLKTICYIFIIAGLKDKWKSDAISTLDQMYDNILYSQSTLTSPEDESDFLQGFISCFVLYFLGITFSIICFFMEILVFRNRTIVAK